MMFAPQARPVDGEGPVAAVSTAGEPNLTVNHLRRLSDCGPDQPAYVAALCPNCDRRRSRRPAPNRLEHFGGEAH